ncbi:hypothetical protein FIV42_04445 [Persicimonas caeni]|uniref:Lipoprotein n=1 Tax=Persicimonas caeni TaxID=2292766 RepID=A0A4Y6PNW4_PERCE|nr:hypothetical protein [Persicimonas caeni]QDG50016.1 hypothetical protein FIV42_04445 [Persicimonas caeni]QED31237.1 hypothetical protein FRD00_04440 [Persicimonas caeni]
MKLIWPAVLLTTILLTACDNRVEPPSAEERQAILKDAPEVFATRDDHATLKGIETLYLGQPKDDALDALAEFCPKTMEYKGGDFAQNAWFRGCVFREPRGALISVRVGFWPKLDDQVATLEVKRTDVKLEAVRERFRDFVDEVTFDVPRAGILEMRSEKYQIHADIDEGADGPTHITMGYTQNWAEKLEKQ